MGTILVKEKGIELPNKQILENCIYYKEKFSLTFVKNEEIIVIKDLETYEDYEICVKHYDFDKNDVMIFYFNGYTKVNVGNLPIVLTTNNSIDDNNIILFKTKASVLFVKEDIAVGHDKTFDRELFVENICHFDRKNNKNIFDLMLGDNLSVILNNDGTIEYYGLENSTTKKWIKENGIIYSDDKYKGYKYNNNYQYNNYNDEWSEYSTYQNYYFNDVNAKTYKCEKCNKPSSFVVISDGKMTCADCID